MLRQKLLCDPDVGVILYNWQKGHRYPQPNFNTDHKCRNISNLLSGITERQIMVWDLPGTSLERPEDEPWVEFDEPPRNVGPDMT